MRLPIDPRDIMSSGAKIAEERERLVRIAVFVDVEAPDELVDVVQEALRPQSSRARLHVEACAPGEALIIDDAADAVIAITGPGDTLAAVARGQPGEVRADGRCLPSTSTQTWCPGGLDTRFSTPSPTTSSTTSQPKLGAWLADRVSGKRLALASNFALVRRAVAVEAVKATSFQNGVIGAVMIIPGADLPIMTANQAKMVLQIAAAYGVPLGTERIKELAAVVGGAFTMRAIARQFLGVRPRRGLGDQGRDRLHRHHRDGLRRHRVLRGRRRPLRTGREAQGGARQGGRDCGQDTRQADGRSRG